MLLALNNWALMCDSVVTGETVPSVVFLFVYILMLFSVNIEKI